MKRARRLGVCLLLLCFTSAQSQDLSLYQKKWFILDADTMPYRLLLPENYQSNQNYPVIFFLHGSGERGHDNESQLAHAGKIFATEAFRKKHKAILVFPQAETDGYWSNVKRNEEDKNLLKRYIFRNGGKPTRDMSMLIKLVRFILQEYHPAKQEIYVGGLSMGGMGTFELVSRMPGVFAKAFPICGGAHPGIVRTLSGCSWRIYHGMKDDVVSYTFSKQMSEAMRKKGITVSLTLFPNANHNAWDPALADTALMNWLFGK